MLTNNPAEAQLGIAKLPQPPSLKDELLARGVFGASMFPDEQVESFSIGEDSRLSITFKQSFQIPGENGLRINIAKNVQAMLSDNGLSQIEGISAEKKILFATVEALILGLRLQAGKVVVQTNNSLLPEISFDISQFERSSH